MNSLHSGLEAWHISAADIDPSKMTIIEKIKFAIRCAILAPSGHNTQPWKFKIRTAKDSGGSADVVEVHYNARMTLDIVDPHRREMFISCGAAFFNLRLALERLGLASVNSHVDYFPGSTDSKLVSIAIESQEAENMASMEIIQLFDQIPFRHTDRSSFDPTRPISEERLTRMQRIVRSMSHELWMEAIVDPIHKASLAELISKGDKAQFADSHFRKELSHWVISNHSDRKDGIPGYSYGYGDLASNLTSTIVRTFDLGNKTAATDSALATGSPALLIFGSTKDTPENWVKTGEALQHVLLELTKDGARASFVNQPIEVDELRGSVADEAMHTHEYPQIILRIGYPKNPTEVTPTPRHSVDEVLL